MSKNRDYTRYSKESTNTVESVKLEEPVESIETVTENTRIEEPEVATVVEPVVGVVTDCTRLNVREAPHSDAAVLGIITAATELIVLEDESTDEFYKICTSIGLEGYCMKKFITIMP